jgi:nitrogen fixation/metabolism regulation signal transduction histidine kinase
MGSEARPQSHEKRVLALALLAGLPGSALGLAFLWVSDWDLALRIGVTGAVVALWFGFARAVKLRVNRSLLTLANLLGAVREGDFSVRGRVGSHEAGFARGGDALGLAFHEINSLTETLREQRLGALEATALLRRVLAEVEVGIFAFDGDDRLRVVNHHGERMLGRPAERVLGSTAAELGLETCLAGDALRTVELSLPEHPGRWLLRRSAFRQGGFPHQLVVLSDASRALREEEHEAWRRLVRVLSHEINNSLAPISSVAGSLEHLLRREPRPSDWEADLESGLEVIAGRSEGLRRIMASYARLAKLPPPQLAPVDTGSWVQRVVAMEDRLRVEISEGPAVVVQADGAQLEQLLINLIGNAVDAALETGGAVRVGWDRKGDALLVWVEDEGPGLGDGQNLFVPFFTTKSDGSGIGLALSRQIAEGHGGELSLRNREGGRGCRAELRLPLR